MTLRLAVLGAGFGALCVLMSLASPALAQETPETTAATEQQVELNDEALEAMNDGNYVRAASLLEQSNHLGHLNVIYLNLGRTYQRLGRCRDARRALKRVGTAPAVASPAPDFVAEKAREYLADVNANCQPAHPNSKQDPSAPVGADETPATPPPAVDNPRATWGWAAAGVGVGLAIGAGALEWQASSLRDDISSADADGDGYADSLTRRESLAKRDDANLYDTLALTGGIASAALVGTGLYLILSDGQASSSHVTLVPGTDALSASWTLRF